MNAALNRNPKEAIFQRTRRTQRTGGSYGFSLSIALRFQQAFAFMPYRALRNREFTIAIVEKASAAQRRKQGESQRWAMF
jgi:hypothetical protein